MSVSKVIVTGGAGFIGSHLTDRLMDEQLSVTVVDNLSSGSLDNVERWLENERFRFIECDLKNLENFAEAVEDAELVFHFAANPEVRVGETDPSVHFEENLLTAFNVLEAMKKSSSAKTLILASTSTVYGEAEVIPTPEDYGPLVPISTYGASKLGCEALACSYSYTFGLRVLILRVANIVGPRMDHGVIIDFIGKLRTDASRLEILGDGTQEKSYLHVKDCVDAIARLTSRFSKREDKVEICNIGSFDQVTVKRIAEIIVEEMGLLDVEFAFTSGVDGGRGWLGDVKVMCLAIEKLLKTGWKPTYNSEEAVRLATRQILKQK